VSWSSECLDVALGPAASSAERQPGPAVTEYGYLVADAGSTPQCLGNLDNRSRRSADLDLSVATVKFNGVLAADPQQLEVAGEDLGPDAAGREDNFAFGELIVEMTTLQLVDAHDNQQDGPDDEALYVDELVIGMYATIAPGDLHLYYRNGGDPKQFFVADSNLDGRVSIADLAVIADHYGMTVGMKWSEGDFNGDGVVGIADLAALSDNYGAGGVDKSVPEPAAVLLLPLGGAFLGPAQAGAVNRAR